MDSNNFNLKQVESYLKSVLKLKSAQYEIFFTSLDSLNVLSQKEKVDFAIAGESFGLGIRVFINKKLGFASTNNITNFKECVDNAIKIANLNNVDKDFKNFASNQKYNNKIQGFNKKLLSFSNEDLKSFLNTYTANLKSIDKNIMIATGEYEKSIKKTRIITSEGLDAEKMDASNSFSAGLLLGENTSFEATDTSKDFLNPKKAIEDAQRIKSMIDKTQTKTQDIKLLLHPEAAADIISTFIGYNFSGENVGLKKSRFFKSLGKQETSKALTITDDSTDNKLLATRKFDDEGFPSQKNILINKGVIKNFLYDSYNANKFKAKNTASAFRSYASLPVISTSNLLVDPGKTSTKKLIEDLDNAIYVKSLLGLHTIDPASGSLSLGVIEGHLIKNGELQKAVKDTMIAGNLFEIFKNIETLSSEVKHGGGAIYTPHILIKNIKLIGN